MNIIYIPDKTLLSTSDQGCQIFLGTLYRKWEKYAVSTQNFPNGHKMFQMVTKCSKWSQNIPNVHKILHRAIKYINILI
jgi:hypothetical protein